CPPQSSATAPATRRARSWQTSPADHAVSSSARDLTKLAVSVATSNPNERCQFVGRAVGKRFPQMVEKGGNAGVQQAPRRVERPQGSLRGIHVRPMHQRAGGQIMTDERY